MIPAYILHPQQRAGGSKRLIRSKMFTLAQALQTCGMVHAEAVFPAAVKIHRQNRAAVAAEQNISDADRCQTLFLRLTVTVFFTLSSSADQTRRIALALRISLLHFQLQGFAVLILPHIAAVFL